MYFTTPLYRSAFTLLLTVVLMHSAAAENNRQTGGEPNDAAAGEEFSAADLPPEQFLAAVRHSFEQNVWGRFSGRVQHRSPRARISTDISLALRSEAPRFMRARITLHRNSIYDAVHLLENRTPEIHIQEPEDETEISLRELGLETEDLMFVFLYWRPIEEKPVESVRGRPCRVLLLQHPEEPEHRLQVWFSKEHLAPLRIMWLRQDGRTPERILEMTDFESRRGVWYVKSFRLAGEDWQTRVRFTDGALHKHENRSPPEDLFPAPHYEVHDTSRKDSCTE